MALGKNLLLWCSTNAVLKKYLPRLGFVRRAVRRFMPGETLDDALEAAGRLHSEGFTTVLTYLGENISRLEEAETVRDHYLEILTQVNARRFPTEISLKLTQLGFDIDDEFTLAAVRELCSRAMELNSFVWIDIESHQYVDRTLDLYRQVRAEFKNVGLCLQSYLYRTAKDLDSLLELGPSIRLVKGAYKEPASIAYPLKKDVDDQFITLSTALLNQLPAKNGRIGIATHDATMIAHAKALSTMLSLPKGTFEFQLLYGIRKELQKRLLEEGYFVRVLISYGSAWYPWYMRRLAERPANVWFVLKSLFG